MIGEYNMADNKPRVYTVEFNEKFHEKKLSKEQAATEVAVPDLSQFKTTEEIARINKVNDYSVSSTELMRDWNTMKISQDFPKTRGVYLDLETLGGMNEDFFNPTEISMRTYKIQNGLNLADVEGASGSSLKAFAVRMDSITESKITALIKAIENSNKIGVYQIGDVERTLKDHEYRALHSLIKYSDENLFNKNVHGLLTTDLDAVRRSAAPEYGVSLKTHIKLIKQGMENLNKYGGTFEEAIQGMNAYFAEAVKADYINSTVLTTHNGKSYDGPAMKFLLDRTVKNNSGATKLIESFKQDWWNQLSNNHVDTYKTLNTFTRDPIGLLDGIVNGKSVNSARLSHGRRLQGGLWRIEVLDSIMFGGDKYHSASIDIEAMARMMPVLGPEVQKIMDTISKGGIYDGVQVDATPIRFGKMGKDGKPLKGVGDIFFSNSGISSNDSEVTGSVWRYSGKRGIWKNAYTGVSGTPLNKNTYYKLMGIQEADTFASALLYNMDDNVYQRITAKDKNTLISTLQQKLDYQGEVNIYNTAMGNAKGAGALKDYFGQDESIIDPNSHQSRLYDRAQRRYRKMYDNSSDGGYNLWRQNHEALIELEKFKAASNIDNITNEALYEAVMGNSKAAQNFRKEAGRIFQLDYTIDPNGKKNSWMHYTTQKVSDLIYMQENLAAERDITTLRKNIRTGSNIAEESSFYTTFMMQFNANRALAQANQNVKITDRTASLALKFYREQMIDKFGQGAITRDPFNFEKNLPVFNPFGNVIEHAGIEGQLFGGKTMSYINVGSVDSSIRGIKGILNQSMPSIGRSLTGAKSTARDLVQDLFERDLLNNYERGTMIDLINNVSDNKTLLNQVSAHIGTKLYDRVNLIYNKKPEKRPALFDTAFKVNTGMESIVADYGAADHDAVHQVAQNAINEALTLSNPSMYNESVQDIFAIHKLARDTKQARALEILRANDKVVKSMFESNYTVDKMRTMESSIAEIATAYKKVGFETRIINDNNVLKLVFYKDGALSNMSADKLIASNKAAIINMPYLDKNGVITNITNKQRRVNQFILDYDPLGTKKLSFKTGYDSIIDTIIDSAHYISGEFDINGKTGAYAGTTALKKKVQDVVTKLSGANERHASSDAWMNTMVPNFYPNAMRKSDMILFRSESMISSFLLDRSSQFYNKDENEYKRLRELAKKRDLQMGDLNLQEVKDFQFYVLERPVAQQTIASMTPQGEKKVTVKQITLQDILSYVSTKENEGLEGMASGGDVRRYLPFGRFISGGSQRVAQALNIRPIKLNDDIINDPYLKGILQRPMLMTKRMADETKDVIPGAMLNTVYTTDTRTMERIKKLHKEGQITDAEFEYLTKVKFPSTYEGQIVTKKSIAALFNDEDIDVKELPENFVFANEFQDVGFGYEGYIGAERGRKITVGGIMVDQHITIKGNLGVTPTIEELTKTNKEYMGKIRKNLQGSVGLEDISIQGVTIAPRVAKDGTSLTDIHYSFIDTSAKTTLTYTHKDAAYLNYDEDDNTLTVKKISNMANSGTKITNAAGYKGTNNTLDDRLFELIFGKGTEVAAYEQAIKKRAPGERLANYVNTAMNNAEAYVLDKDTAMENIRQVVAKYEELSPNAVKVSNRVTTQGSNTIEGSRMTVDFDPRAALTVGKAIIKNIQQELAGAIGASTKQFESLLFDENTEMTRSMEEWRRAHVGEYLGVMGGIARKEDGTFSDLKSLGARDGILKIGPREILALESHRGPNGETLGPVVDWVSGYVNHLSNYQNPGLQGNTVRYDSVNNRYITQDEDAYIREAKVRKKDIYDRPNKIQSSVNIITNDKPGVVFGYAGDDGNFINLESADSLTTVGDISKEINIRRDILKDTTNRRMEGHSLTGEDFRGTIVDIQGSLKDLARGLDKDNPKRNNLEALINRINEDGGFYLELFHPVEIKKYESDTSEAAAKKVINKQWFPLEELVSIGKPGEEQTLTTGKLNTALLTIDRYNEELIGLTSGGTDIPPALQKRFDKAKHPSELQGIKNDYVIETYNNLKQKIVDYRQTGSTLISGTDGFVNSANTARLDFAGQFRVQIISPTQNEYLGGDAQMFIHPEDYKAMQKGMTNEAKQFMASQDSIYALANRYPTTYSKSLMAAKLGQSTEVERGTVMISAGMLMGALGDGDGDFVSMTLAHYDSQTYVNASKAMAPAIRNATIEHLEGFHKAMQPEFDRLGSVLLDDMQKTFNAFGADLEEMNFTSRELGNIVKAFSGKGVKAEARLNGMETLLNKLNKGGMINKLDNEGKRRLLMLAEGGNDFANELENIITAIPQNGGLADAEALINRELRRNIGPASNTSSKVRQLGNEVSRAVEKDFAGNTTLFTAKDMQILDANMQIIEQSPISSKHISLMTDEELSAMSPEEAMEKARNIAREKVAKESLVKSLLSGDKEAFVKLNEELGGVFKPVSPNAPVNGLGNAKEGLYQTGSINELFDTVQKLRNVYGGQDLNEVIKKPEFQIGASEGVKDPEQIADLMNSAPDVLTQGARGLYEATGKQDLIDASEAKLNNRLQFLADNPIYNKSYSTDAKFSTVGSETKNAITRTALELSSATPFAAGAAAFGGAWAISAMFRKSPYDRANEDKTDAEGMAMQGSGNSGSDGPYIPQADMSSPTARITPVGGGYENLQINLRASSFNGMTNDQIISMVSQELQNQSPIRMNINANTKDQSTKVDRKWVNDVVSRATRYGMGF